MQISTRNFQRKNEEICILCVLFVKHGHIFHLVAFVAICCSVYVYNVVDCGKSRIIKGFLTHFLIFQITF